MTDELIKNSILKLIEEVYCKKYIGTIEVEALNPIGWKIRLGLINDEKPTVIAAELPDNKFLRFFRRELLDNNWDCIKWFKGYLK